MPLGVRWLSVGPGSGYGDSAQAYLRGLREAGVPVQWTPMNWPSTVWDAQLGPVRDVDEGTPHRDLVGNDIAHDTVVVHSTPLWHERLEVEADGRTLIAFTTWEADRLPGSWIPILNRYDRVLVPSRFNARAFTESGVEPPVAVVPHIARPISGVSRSGSGSAAEPGRFTFYVLSTWTTRKALPDLVQAFIRAFTASDPVRLVIHTSPDDLIHLRRVTDGKVAAGSRPAGTWFTLARLLAGHRHAPEITLSTRKLTREEIDELHAAGDCFVSLSRGEGWGLGAFDAAGHGNPVIVTGWGGPLDYLPSGYPYFIDYELIPTIQDDADAFWQPEFGHRWARASVEHAAELMRHAFHHPREARDWGRRLQAAVQTEFASARVTRRLLDALA